MTDAAKPTTASNPPAKQDPSHPHDGPPKAAEGENPAAGQTPRLPHDGPVSGGVEAPA